MKAVVRWLLLGSLVMVPATVFANPADTHGLGSRPVSMAGAVAADTRDFSANYYNPSGLVLAERLRVSVGVQAVNPDLSIDGEPSPASSFRASLFGFAAPGEIAVPVAFGAAMHLSGDRLSRITTFREEDQRWVLHDDRPEQIYVAANAAVRPFPFLTLGLGLTFLASTDGVLSLRGTATQPGFSGQDEFDSTIEHEVIAELRSERYPTAGFTLLPAEEFSVGLVYRGEARIVLDVASEFDGDVALGPLSFPGYYTLESTTVQSFVPRQLVLGTSYQGIERARLNLDLQYTQWSSYVSPLSATQSELDIDTRGLIAVPELPAPTQLDSARLGDRVTPRVGVEYVLALSSAMRAPLRLGYFFQATPLTRGSVANFVDADRHVVSFGAGLLGPGPGPLSGSVALDVHAAWSWFAPRDVPGPDAEQHRAAGSILVLGATLGIDL